MDERVKSTYEKIYAELFRIVLFGCCVSIIIKTAVLGMGALDCIPEYPILVGCPVYLLIRGRMLGVTQVMVPANKFKQNLVLTLVCALAVSVFVFVAVLQNRGKDVEWANVLGFAFSFIGCFLAAQIGFRKWAERQQKKMDDKYDD